MQVSEARQARVYAYDVAYIVRALETSQPPTQVLYGLASMDWVIDGFFHWALDSFQLLGVRDQLSGSLRYNPFNYPQEVHNWFRENEWAQEAFYSIVNVENRYAGREVIIVRRRNALWLFVLV